MKKNLFMVLMALLCFAVLPSCDKKEDETNNFDLLAGKYSGSLVLDLNGEEVANPLFVNVATKDGNKIDLSLDPISIKNMEIKDLNFQDIPVTENQEAWDFALDSKTSINEVEFPVSVKGSLSNDQLTFTVNVKQDGAEIPLSYKGTKK